MANRPKNQDAFPSRYSHSFSFYLSEKDLSEYQFSPREFFNKLYHPLWVKVPTLLGVDSFMERPFLDETKIVQNLYDKENKTFVVTDISKKEEVKFTTSIYIDTLTELYTCKVVFNCDIWFDFVLYKYFVIPLMKRNAKKFLCKS